MNHKRKALPGNVFQDLLSASALEVSHQHLPADTIHGYQRICRPPPSRCVLSPPETKISEKERPVQESSCSTQTFVKPGKRFFFAKAPGCRPFDRQAASIECDLMLQQHHETLRRISLFHVGTFRAPGCMKTTGNTYHFIMTVSSLGILGGHWYSIALIKEEECGSRIILRSSSGDTLYL